MSSKYRFKTDGPDPYAGVTGDYYDPSKIDLLDRWQPVTDWFYSRRELGLDPYCKVTTARIAPATQALDATNRPIAGVNFASQEYLSLASHPKVLEAAFETANEFGVHSAGSTALMGLSGPLRSLEERLAAFLEVKDATVFSTGWQAGYGAIRTLTKKGDHILLDVLAHACLQEASDLSGAKVHRFPHCSTEAVERRLRRIRDSDRTGGILVVTEGVFSMDSDVPDIAALQSVCEGYNATLFVDVAHDLGALGDTGRGMIEAQGMLGRVDVVMGSFSKTFASNGGFVATNHPAMKLALRSSCGPMTFTNALSPVQAATVMACLDVIEDDEGEARRTKLMSNIIALRNGLENQGFKLLGQPSAIVPVILGDNTLSRVITREVFERGALVNLVEHPAVSRNACRWRLQVMADHSEEQIEQFIEIACDARAAGEKYLALHG